MALHLSRGALRQLVSCRYRDWWLVNEIISVKAFPNKYSSVCTTLNLPESHWRDDLMRSTVFKSNCLVSSGPFWLIQGMDYYMIRHVFILEYYVWIILYKIYDNPFFDCFYQYHFHMCEWPHNFRLELLSPCFVIVSDLASEKLYGNKSDNQNQ